MKEWINWSGSLRFTPQTIQEPRDEGELRNVVAQSYSTGSRVKIVGAGHSSSPLVKTEQTLVNLKHFGRLVKTDNNTMTATFGAGITVHEALSALEERSLALFNTGDVDVQTLAGAISTGTHGTGRALQNLGSLLVGVRLIDYKGEIKTFNENDHPEIMRAMRVSLGAFGIFSEIQVRVVPLFDLHRVEFFTSVDSCAVHFDRLANENRNVDFYWYPRSDEIKIRILNDPKESKKEYQFDHYCKKEEQGRVGHILPRKRSLKFEEIEYAVPYEKGMDCFLAIRKRIKEKHRREVAWRVLVRTIASDDSYLSPHFGRDSIAISVHHNAGLPFESFFKDLEPIFVHFEGRPHWAKKHWRRGEDLQPIYPEWDNFQRLRRQLDPDGYFLNDHLKDILNTYEKV